MCDYGCFYLVGEHLLPLLMVCISSANVVPTSEQRLQVFSMHQQIRGLTQVYFSSWSVLYQSNLCIMKYVGCIILASELDRLPQDKC